MIKKSVYVLLILLLFCVTVFAEYIDVVHLKNGSIIKGVIIEQIPGESIKIETKGGSIFVYKFTEIQKLSKEKVKAEVKKVEGTDKNFSVTVFPIGMAFSYYSFEAEFKLSQELSLPLEIKVFAPSSSSWDTTFLSIGPGLRFYPAGNGLQGVFVAPYVSFLSASFEYEYLYDTGDYRKASGSAAGFSLSAWFGYRILAGPVLFEFSTGFGFYSISGEVTYKNSTGLTRTEEYSGMYSGFTWNGLGLGVGFAF